LVQELLALHDAEAEQSLLNHGTNAVTVDLFDRAVLPESLVFRNVNEYTTAVLYWEFRLLAVNAILELARLIPLPSELDLPRLHEMQVELIWRLVSAWQWPQAEGVFVSVHIAIAFVAAWAGLARKDTLNELSAAALRRWIYPKLSHPLLKPITPSTEAGVDSAAYVLLGGPLPMVPS